VLLKKNVFFLITKFAKWNKKLDKKLIINYLYKINTQQNIS